ncbi:MAG: HDOD domain-containing protein [Rubrivivax sp.]|nr:HDOD domain-containing protein [Rubrivivax sp.]
MSAAAAAVGQLARFQLLRELGRGAQARVWLAHDPRLDREVALKLLDPAADAIAVSQWLHEARSVSRLTHPNIVPVFEADEIDGQPYLVFEYVDGPTLAQARRGKPPMAAREAATLLLGVLDALAAAHDQGLVHRDLKPSNILLGRDGRARVMDFGIAARVAGDASKSSASPLPDGLIVGTPGYMSPEAARGEAPVPAMDVFAAGVMLGELLSGAPLLRETDPYRAVERVQHEDLVLPAQVKVDEVLRSIVQRALARDLRMRFDGARAMHTALSAWMQPAAEVLPASGQSSATLEFLLRRMRRRTDFPALSSSIVNIQRVASSDKVSLKSLTDEILKDVALTNKLLRMVNSAHFSSVAGGGVGTVSRAVALVGFAGIRNMALSVLLLEHMSDKSHVALLKEEFLRALMAGTLADALAGRASEGEEAFLGAMFQNLGRLLTEYYLPEEAEQIHQQIGDQGVAPAEREAAARRVLGIGLQELGAGVAKAWGLPDHLVRALDAPEGEIPARAADRQAERGEERLRWLGRGANAMADAMLGSDGDEQASAMARVADQYATVLGVVPRDIVSAAQASRVQMAQTAQALGLQVAQGSPARRLLQATQPSGEETLSSDKTQVLQATPALTPAAAHSLLSQALDDARGALATRRLGLSELLNLVLDTMHRALDFRCVVLCLREPGSGRLVGRLGLGAGSDEIRAAFRVAPDGAAVGDLFAVLTAKGADVLIADASQVAGKLPAWYRQHVNAATFLLLPLMLKGAPIGLIYADKARAGSIALGEGEMLLLQALRDQVAAAFAKA